MTKAILLEGVEIGFVPGGELYVESYVRLPKGETFGPVWVGRRTYANDAVLREGTRIGRYCSIARRVTIGAQSHPKSWLSTHPFQRENGFKRPDLDFTLRDTFVGHDVWISENCIVAAGSVIGHGAIIGAGSVVTSQVEPYAIMGGVPARKIGQRFSNNIISELLELKWWLFKEEALQSLQWDDVAGCLDVLRELSRDDTLRSPESYHQYNAIYLNSN